LYSLILETAKTYQLYSLILETAKTYHVNECLALLAESGSETTSEALKIQNFPGGRAPRPP